MTIPRIPTNRMLRGIRYEIRGEPTQRSLEHQRKRYDIIELNIGNRDLFGYSWWTAPVALNRACRCRVGRPVISGAHEA